MKKIIFKILSIFLLIFALGGNAYADFSFRDMELSFVQISDVHISDREDTSYKVLSKSKDLLKDAIEQVNGLKPVDFVMFTGDIVNEPLKKSYRDFFVLLTKLKYPSLAAFGNHDMAQMNGDVSGAPDYISKKEALSIIKKCNPLYMFDKSYYAFTPKREYRVIVLDTTIDDSITANGRLTDEQAQFLKNEIDTHQDKVILIFEHHPVVEPFKSEHHKILNSDAYMDIIRQYKKTPIAIFSGHYHAAKIKQQGNIIHVSTPALVTYPNAFRYVNITNYKDRTIFNFKYLETRLDDVQKNSKLNVIASATLRGLPSDQETVITIRKSRDNNNDYKEETPKAVKEDKQIEKEQKQAQKQAASAQKAAEKKAREAEKANAKEALKREKLENKELQREIELQAKETKKADAIQKKELKEAQKEARRLEKERDKALKEDLKKQNKINEEVQEK